MLQGPRSIISWKSGVSPATALPAHGAPKFSSAHTDPQKRSSARKILALAQKLSSAGKIF